MKTQDLSDYKLSQWIRLALADLLKCEKDSRYKIDMGFWHYPNSYCVVCMAGAVMAKTLHTDITLHATPSNTQYDAELDAIDSIREGYIYYALAAIGESLGDLPNKIEVTEYHKDRLQWRKDMFSIARMLEGEGL